MRRTLAQIAGITAPHYRNGGHVRGPGTGTSDSINAKLSDGEFVVPADTVRKVGARRLQDLVDMTHTPSGKPPQPGHYADGGFTRRPGFNINSWSQEMDQQRAASTQAAQAAGQAAMAEAEAIGQAAAAAKRAQAAAPPPASPPAASPASASLDQRLSQIPTGGQTAPAADGSQSSWSNTETGRNLSNIATALPGSLGGAIPAVAKTGGAISGGINAATRLLNAGAGAAAISAIPGAVAAQNTPASAAGAGRGTVNPAAVDPAAPRPFGEPAAPGGAMGSAATTTSDVTRVGNSYSGTNVAGDITVNGRAAGGGYMNTGDTSAARSAVGMTPEGVSARDRLMAAGTGQAPAGQVSLQNMGAADNLAAGQSQGARARLLAAGTSPAPGVPAPVVRHSGNDWQARNDLRNLEVSAKSITNRPEWSGAGMNRFRGGQGGPSVDVTAFQSAFESDRALKALEPAMELGAARENAGLQREGMQQAGETQRTNIRAEGMDAANQIARGRLTIEQIAAGQTSRAADRIDRAQVELENAKTPEAQRSARDRLMALAGRVPQNEWGVQVTPATKNADGSSTQGSVYRFNKATGETVRVDEGQGNAGQAPAKDNMVRGQVYQTRGGAMRWNGSSFERVG